MKKKVTNIIIIIILLVGLSLLLYPHVANYWNSFTQSTIVSGYLEKVADLDDDTYKKIWEEACDYNEKIASNSSVGELTESEKKEYESVLNVNGNGVMGFVEIPTVSINLPVYHGTEETMLQVAVGHLDWSSLPVGGESSHCVISGHRGLPSARLFTDLDQLRIGDVFMLHVLDEVLTYEIDQIIIVEPHEINELYIQEGKDLCTMVTCTPYGINSHRLLIRGHRADDVEEESVVRVTADALIIEKMVVVPFVLAPFLLVMLIFFLISAGQKRNRRKKK